MRRGRVVLTNGFEGTLDSERGLLVIERISRRAWSKGSSRGQGPVSQTGIVRIVVEEIPVNVEALREQWSERSAIREYDGTQERRGAERDAWRDVARAAAIRASRGG